jgi:alpha-D-xyloside xylohydrolase
MRSHGTQTPREIWRFGKQGDWAYDAIEKFIRLRYRLLPYNYSLSWDVTAHGGSVMRALMMDFPEDEKVYDLDNEYMFGHSILVCPVTDSLYVKRENGTATVDFSRIKTRRIYLPQGTAWYDFWSGEKAEGGKTIDREVPIDRIPLYIKAGTILPLGDAVQYAGEKNRNTLNLYVFPGANAEFVLYEDENDNYNYEKGVYSTITMKWNDRTKTLVIGKRQGEFPGMSKKRTFNIFTVNAGKSIDTVSKPDRQVEYNGAEVIVKTQKI